MVSSMTGFSRSAFSVDGLVYTAEIRTLNHKTLDIHCKLPERLAALEMPVRALLNKYISRGRVDVRISVEYGSDSGILQLNEPVYQAYCKIIADLAQEHKINSLDPVALLALPNILLSINPDPDHVAEFFQAPLEEALLQLSQDRRREGVLLWQDIQEKLNKIQGLIAQLKSLALQQVQEVGDRFRQRLAKLDENIDDNRLLTEIAILVDKSDINEELVRLQAHIGEFSKCGSLHEPVGRRLEFLGQEMLREVNTVGAKSAIYEVSKAVVDIKTELEKIREQVQNIE